MAESVGDRMVLVVDVETATAVTNVTQYRQAMAEAKVETADLGQAVDAAAQSLSAEAVAAKEAGEATAAAGRAAGDAEQGLATVRGCGRAGGRQVVRRGVCRDDGRRGDRPRGGGGGPIRSGAGRGGPGCRAGVCGPDGRGERRNDRGGVDCPGGRVGGPSRPPPGRRRRGGRGGRRPGRAVGRLCGRCRHGTRPRRPVDGRGRPVAVGRCHRVHPGGRGDGRPGRRRQRGGPERRGRRLGRRRGRHPAPRGDRRQPLGRAGPVRAGPVGRPGRRSTWTG